MEHPRGQKSRNLRHEELFSLAPISLALFLTLLGRGNSSAGNSPAQGTKPVSPRIPEVDRLGAAPCKTLAQRSATIDLQQCRGELRNRDHFYAKIHDPSVYKLHGFQRYGEKVMDSSDAP
jgi:hypothetical protein